MTIAYTVILDPEDDGGFAVTVPSLPEVVTYGDNREEALENARDAITLALEVRRDLGEAVPADVAPSIERVEVPAA